jgi:hypothetical protein
MRVFQLWEEVVSITTSIELSEEEEPVWQFSSRGVYTFQSLYSIINFRGCSQYTSLLCENC